MNTKELIEQAITLPVEERARLVDALLRCLNTTQPEIDVQWATAAKRRRSELRYDKVETVPGEAVFERIRKRFHR